MKKSRLLGAVCACVFTLITTSTNAEFIETDSLTLTGVPLELIFFDGSVEAISFNGSTEYDVFFPFAEGSAVDGDFDGREEVATEMTSLNLTGNSGSMGSIVIALSPSPASMGGLFEKANINTGVLDVPPFSSDGFVDSFFDVFVDISFSGLELHNADPARIIGTWSQKPSTHNEFIAMFTDFSPVELFDGSGNATGVLLGPGQVIPIPAAAWLFGTGLLGLIGVATRKKSA